MGLDFSHGDAHWGYGGFNRFRTRLAKEIRVDLDSMEGFEREEGKRGTPWSTVKDPIVPLLDHSDCDEDLSPEVCTTVAPRLLELIADWPDDDYDKINAKKLAEGMINAANNGERLEFR